MAYIDNELIFLNDVDTAATVNSAVLDLGTKGAWLHPLYIDVKLTKALASGNITTIKVQSAATKEFTAPADEMQVTVPAAVNQTAGPATLAQFFAPIRTGNRYVRIVVTGTSPTGGKLTAYMSSGAAVNL
ncbi:MAG: hypothetical protein MJZ99_07085 [Bacteroidales bacterium]|nr:hypothetical protein [Bacteroidales bacterium]